MNNNFKLIAIQPLEGCPYAKVLKENEIYYFSNDYQITEDTITYAPSIPDDLYTIKREKPDLNINIHAIVGKNGSGKSTIIELVAMLINNIARSKESLKSINGEFYHNLQYVEGLKVRLYYLYKKGQNSEIRSVTFDNSCNCSCYIKDGNVFKLAEGECSVDFDEFFYTFLINYSLYSFNDKDYNYWTYGIFNKNDGYQVPLNIYPLRSEGNIDVKNETHLTKSRFLSNLVHKDEKGSLNNIISDDKEVSFVEFKKYKSIIVKIDGEEKIRQKPVLIFSEKEIYFEDLNINVKEILSLVFKVYNIKFYGELYKENYEYGHDAYTDTCNYIVTKLVRILVQYETRYWDVILLIEA